MEKKESELGM